MPTPRTRRHTVGDRVYSRAQARALRRLRQTHPDEYSAFLDEELNKATAEQEQLVAAGHRPDVKLRQGTAAGQPALARVRLDVAACPLCIDRHDHNHVCSACGVRPGTRRVPAETCRRCTAPRGDRGQCVVDRPDIGKRFVLEAHDFTQEVAA